MNTTSSSQPEDTPSSVDNQSAQAAEGHSEQVPPLQEAFTAQSFTSEEAEAPTQKVPAIPTSKDDLTALPAQNIASEQAMEHATVAVYPPATTPPTSKPPRRMVSPLPRWAFILGILAILVALGVTFATGSDWAEGALRAGIVATSIAGVLTLLLIIRSLAGMAAQSNPHRRSQYISAILIILILFASGGTGLFANDSMHGLQAHYLEGQKQWESAIKEYQLAGETGPNSSNIARTYAEWGEDLSQSGNYGPANNKFDSVITNYSKVSDEVNRAEQGETHAYIEWGKHDLKQHDYTAAASHLNMALNLDYCSAECRGEANPLAATAYYNKAENMLNVKDYRVSADAFTTVQSRFPQSPEAQMMHADMSKALLGKGKLDRNIVCADAIPTYQELVQKFADTPAGREAKIALSAPEGVTGHFIQAIPKASDGYTTVQAALIAYQPINISNDSFYQQLAAAPTATISSDGYFSFKPLPQGSYDLVWGVSRTDGSQTYTSSSFQNSTKPYYVAQVGPLCAFNFGDMNVKFLPN